MFPSKKQEKKHNNTEIAQYYLLLNAFSAL
jgi:hypothetical protein